jgi:AraC family transcriptional regulator
MFVEKVVMPKEETLNYYQNKVKDIVFYIQNNLDKDLNVKTLAEKSNISFFHFHRIIRACLDVPLGTYINQLRLDTAAKLIKYSNENISEIAIKIGYSDLSAFSKSFIREFGISPSDYRLNKDSAINSTLNFHFKHDAVEKHHLSPKIINLPTRKVAFIELIGEYGGKECEEAWNLLLDFAKINKILSWNLDAFSIYYDDPEEVGVNNCKYDSCITIKKSIKPSSLIKIKEIEGGKYLVFRYKGPYEKLWDVYQMLFRDFIVLLDKYQVRDSPMIEKYIKYSAKTKAENMITEIYIPIN